MIDPIAALSELVAELDLDVQPSCPKAIDWPSPPAVRCCECGQACSTGTYYLGSRVHHYLCPDGHRTALLAEEAGHEWRFEEAPF